MLAIHARSCWSRQVGSAPTWGPRPQRSRSKKASRSSWKPSSAAAARPACASSTATFKACPGESKQTEELMDTIITRGVGIPRLGFGTFRMPGGGCQPVVESALALGYRHLDTAAIYENEDAVSAA